MKTYKEQQLMEIIPRKGISLKRRGRKLFGRLDYFQVVNGYKFLFTQSIEKLADIKRKILSRNGGPYIAYYAKLYNITNHNALKPADFYERVCRKICDKYGISFAKNATVASIEREINNIAFERHIYNPNSDYEDFVRMYYFEHELRSVLLKYILLIEERIKKVFISVLNDIGVDANCLADISKYDLCRGKNAQSLKSLGKIIAMHSDVKSKPIFKKMEQELTVPYWILINEMTLKQTLITIDALRDPWRMKIKQELTNKLSMCVLNVFDKTKGINQLNSEKKRIYRFFDILFHLADFRNHLAHNQPLYCYNVEKHFPIAWAMPRVKVTIPGQYLNDQRRQNLTLLNEAENFFGADAYNRRTNASTPFDINLSWLLYLINRITNITMPENDMKEAICELYKKYNIILCYSASDYHGKVNDQVLSFLRKGRTNGKFTEFDTNSLSGLMNKISKDGKNSKYHSFQMCGAYFKYTSIDSAFLTNILW